ncbi:MAG: START domain-containing protein [Bacteroidota bacterium]
MRTILILFNLLITIYLFAQSWEFIKERDGIKIYTQKEKGSPLKSFKGVMEIRSTMEMIGTVVGNVKNFDWWDDAIRKIDVLAHEDNVYSQYYLIYDVPWPLMDRDLCVNAKVTIDPVTGTKVILARPLPDVIPEDPTIIRIKNYWQKWSIQPLKNGMIRLTLEGFVDPGGIVPSWLYNMVITETPLNLMREVKKRVELPKKF